MIFPVMVICLLPFLYLFRMLLCQMILEKGLDECLKQISIEMYVLERASILPENVPEEEEGKIELSKLEQFQIVMKQYTDFFEEEGWKEEVQEWGYDLVGEILLKQKLQRWLENENLNIWGIRNGWNGIQMLDSSFLYEEDGHHYLLKGVLAIQWNSLFSFWTPKRVTIQRVYHGFVGENNDVNEESENKEETENSTVYRIGEGNKYHNEDCFLIQKDVYASTKQQSETEGREACIRCSPENLVTVYQTKGGEHYHTKHCTYLNPTITVLNIEEAIQLGYTGCRLCQEENQYFS